MSQPDATSRLVTFESDTREQLVVLAGNSERDHRTIFSDRVEGRYAIVPVDDLVSGNDVDGFDIEGDALVQDMKIVGQQVVLPEDGAGTVSLSRDGQRREDLSLAGVYGLLWVPLG